METLLQDLRYGVRMLIKNPAFTMVAVIALALGIGANTAIFSVVNTVLLKPLHYGDPDRLMLLWESNPQSDLAAFPVSPLNFTDWKRENKSFEMMAARQMQNFNLSGVDEPERLVGEIVSDGYFKVIDVTPVHGRFFTEEESRSGGDGVVVLSSRLWKRRFGSDPNIVGKSITLNNQARQIVGIAPDDHRPMMELWTPLVMETQSHDRGWHSLQVLGRLKPGVSQEQGALEMKEIASRLATQYPESNTGWGVQVIPLHEQIVKSVRPALFILLGAVGFVLLIACANVANLLLARVSARRREIAIRTALGAGRLRLVRQLLTESLVLALVGGALGTLLALWGTELISTLNVVGIPRAEEISVDGTVLLFTLLVSILTGVVFGLLPALHAAKSNLTGMLKEGSRGLTGGRGSRRVRSGLILSEVALALLLLVGAGLLIRSFGELQDVDPGFDTDNVLTVRFSLPPTKYNDPQKQAAYFTSLLERMDVLPGVESVAASTTVPLAQGGPMIVFVVDGRPVPSQHNAPTTNVRTISPGYFQTMKIPLRKGRLFGPGDNAGSSPVAIINETMAEKVWPGEDPIGKRMTLGIYTDVPPDSIPWITIVGVSADVKHNALNAESEMELYTPYLQNPDDAMTLLVRTKSDPLAMVPSVRSEAMAIDRDIPLFQIQTLEEVVSNAMAQPRFYMLLLAIFAGVALLLAAIGIYGVIAQGVVQQTHEIGIRMALGARRADIVRLVVGEGVVVTLIGVALGLALAFGLTRLLENLLFGVGSTDPITYLCVSIVLIAVAVVACYIPARRATKVDPIEALRYE